MQARTKRGDGLEKGQVTRLEWARISDEFLRVLHSSRRPFILAGSRAGAKVIGTSGFESRPLRDRASAGPHWLPSRRAAVSSGVGALLRPAGRRVLPLLLPPVDGQVQQVIVVIHHLYPAGCRPIRLK